METGFPRSAGINLGFPGPTVAFAPNSNRLLRHCCIVRSGDAYHLRPGDFGQTLEPVELIELSPVEEHGRTMATVARNMGLAS